ncbi:MAG: hypothetical protein IKM62_01280 [Kiritimatiellae bacterium]|nr:hypothetical protein [Kiritimatiellia bacterium]
MEEAYEDMMIRVRFAKLRRLMERDAVDAGRAPAQKNELKEQKEKGKNDE